MTALKFVVAVHGVCFLLTSSPHQAVGCRRQKNIALKADH